MKVQRRSWNFEPIAPGEILSDSVKSLYKYVRELDLVTYIGLGKVSRLEELGRSESISSAYGYWWAEHQLREIWGPHSLSSSDYLHRTRLAASLKNPGSFTASVRTIQVHRISADFVSPGKTLPMNKHLYGQKTPLFGEFTRTIDMLPKRHCAAEPLQPATNLNFGSVAVDPLARRSPLAVGRCLSVPSPRVRMKLVCVQPACARTPNCKATTK